MITGKNLVLTRKAGERIMIGNDIIVKVVLIKGDKAKIMITAPSNIEVDREEIRELKTFKQANYGQY